MRFAPTRNTGTLTRCTRSTPSSRDEMGPFNLHIPEAYGGPGLGCMEEVLVNEELARAILASPQPTPPRLRRTIITGATEAQQWLRKIAEEGALASYAVTEPGAGSDVAAITTRHAETVMNVINGSKMWTKWARVMLIFFVLAKTDPDAGYRGMSGFTVEPTVRAWEKGNQHGQRCSDTRSITFENVRVLMNHLIGSPNQVADERDASLDLSRPNIAAHATGLARAAYEHALTMQENAEVSKTASPAPAIQFMLADMKTKIEASRLPTAICRRGDAGVRNTESAAHAKRFASDSAMEVATDAVQVYGGYGYSVRNTPTTGDASRLVTQIYEAAAKFSA